MAMNYENLDIWKKSITLATCIYTLTRQFPKEEVYGLTSQIRRAVISISSNIAEGAGRGTKKDFLRFIMIALGSLNEVESQIHVSRQLHYLTDAECKEILNKVRELGNLLGGFRNYLKK